MGSYPLGSNGYQTYNYHAPFGAHNENAPDSIDDLLANDCPLVVVREDQPRCPKALRQRLHDAIKAAKPKKHGFFHKMGDFFKGIGNGVKHIVQSLINPKNWLLIAGAIALCIVFPPAGAILAGFGAVMAGKQMVKGASSGNWEEVGEGTLNLGLSVIGFKGATRGVKTGGVKYTLSGTKTAAAEANLSKAEIELSTLQKAGADAQKIQKAEQAVSEAKQAQRVALENQARIETARMNFWSKSSFLDDTETADLRTEQVQVKVAQTTDDLNVAQSQFNDAELTLREAQAAGDDDVIWAAKDNYYQAQNNLEKATQANLDMLKVERIKKLKDLRYSERVQEAALDQWATIKDSLGTIRGKTLTSADGRTVTYWKRTPQNPVGGLVERSPNNASIRAIVKNWWTPDNRDNSSNAPRSGFSLPKGGDPNLQLNNTPNGQNSKQTAAAARAAKEAIVAKWQAWRNGEPIKDVRDQAWDNKYNAVVPISEMKHQHDYDLEDEANALENSILPFELSNPGSQFSFILPA